MSSPASVGELLDRISSRNPKIKLPLISEKDRNRLLASPPEIIADPASEVFKIKLADGNYLNLRAKYQ